MTENKVQEPVPLYQVEENDQLGIDMVGVGYDKNQPAVVIERPAKGISLSEDGLAEYKVWGWVKISANFIYHIKLLRGAKLSIWQTISLSIDEDGTCKFSLNDLVKLTGYSRSEVSESLKELDEMGYLHVKKEKGRSSIYEPNFAARDQNTPSSIPIQKSDGSTHPVRTHNHPSSPSIEKTVPTIKELKELERESIYIDFKNMTVVEARKVPTLKLYAQATDYFPGSPTWEFIHKTITEHNLTYETLKMVAEAWALNSFKPGNIKGILEWAVNGIPDKYRASLPKEPKRNQERFQPGPEKKYVSRDEAIARGLIPERKTA